MGLVVTSPEGIARAKSHDWAEINDQTEQCQKCFLILSKTVNLEDVPGCTAPDVCPECFKPGKYEGRILLSGRGTYMCDDGHIWQDLNEVPRKGVAIL